jgi:hypothetical protein
MPARRGTRLAPRGSAGEVTFMSPNLLSSKAIVDQETGDDWGTVPQEPAERPQDPSERSSMVIPVSDQRPVTAIDSADDVVKQCRYCTETLPPGAKECPLCLRDVQRPVADARKTTQPSSASGTRPPTATTLAGASLTGSGFSDPSIAAVASSGATSPDSVAVYTLESPAQCPECAAEISTIHVIRVLRTQVSFTSTLPRKAYVIACPACRRLLSAGLSGLF